MVYSHLDPVFKPIMRHAESTDTRQAIRRHDSDEENRRRKREEHGDEGDDLWTDRTVVSVIALKAFLEDLLYGENRIQTEKTPDSSNPEDHSSSQAQQTQSVSAKAAGAYQQTYQATHVAPPPGATTPPQRDKDAKPQSKLSERETAICEKLIGDLDHIAERQVAELTISKGKNMLQSILEAVKEFKEKYPE